MNHVAIMKKSWRMLPKILSGEKKIESRWYKFRHVPWNNINPGDMVYFKNSGEPVTVRSKVKKIKRFEALTRDKVRKLLAKYGGNDGISTQQIGSFYERFKDKKFCLLIFLENPEQIQPFNIDKKGFGAMSAWISVKNVSEIRR